MLLFIINFPLALYPHCIFQNILCYCLSKTTALWYITNMNFKTSYVIVYQQRFLGVQKLILDFKTSYVIVYLNSANHDSNNTEFQNILCYCLSITALIDEPIGLIFQNILCYCLSISAVQIVPHS